MTTTAPHDRLDRDLATWVTDEVRARYEAAGHWTDETWFEVFERSVTADPLAVAVADERAELTRGEVLHAARRLAAHLHHRGVRRGDTVTLLLPNCVEFVVAHAAVGVLGAVVNPVLPRLAPKDLRHILRQAGSRFVLAASADRAPSPLDLARDAAAEVPGVLGVLDVRGEGLRALLAEPWEQRFPLPEITDRSARDWDTITTTSGTAALPKCVVHSHQSTMFGLRAYVGGLLGLGAADPVFMPSPVCHASGLQWGLRTAIYAGAPLILQDRWDPRTALDALRRHGCTYSLAATPFLIDLVEAERRDPGPPLALRHLASGGAQIPRRLVREVREVLGAEMLSVFGSSETYIATATRPGDPDELLESDGLPLPGTETVTVDLDLAPTAPGVDGEILTRGPHVFLGYLGDPATTRDSFHGEWYRFGDLGRFDEHGCLHVTGRLKDIVIRGGENISVREVEEILLTHPAVREAAVVGYPDPRLGERCCAVLVLVPGAELDLAAVTGFLLGAGLARFKLPERLRLIDAMPMTATGKIRKVELRALVAEQAS